MTIFKGNVSETDLKTYLVVSVGEVKAGNVHASVEHLDEALGVPAGGSEGADDLGLSLG